MASHLPSVNARLVRGSPPLKPFSFAWNKSLAEPTTSLAKYSGLYLLRPLTLERGCLTPDRHFSAAAEQADFVGYKLQKTRNLQLAKSGCSCVVGIGNLEAVRKDFLCQRGRKRYIKPATAISSRTVFSPAPTQRESSISSEAHSWRVLIFYKLRFLQRRLFCSYRRLPALRSPQLRQKSQ